MLPEASNSKLVPGVSVHLTKDTCVQLDAFPPMGHKSALHQVLLRTTDSDSKDKEDEVEGEPEEDAYTSQILYSELGTMVSTLQSS